MAVYPIFFPTRPAPTISLEEDRKSRIEQFANAVSYRERSWPADRVVLDLDRIARSQARGFHGRFLGDAARTGDVFRLFEQKDGHMKLSSLGLQALARIAPAFQGTSEEVQATEMARLWAKDYLSLHGDWQEA